MTFNNIVLASVEDEAKDSKTYLYRLVLVIVPIQPCTTTGTRSVYIYNTNRQAFKSYTGTGPWYIKVSNTKMSSQAILLDAIT